jgi:hypothetical protein
MWIADGCWLNLESQMGGVILKLNVEGAVDNDATSVDSPYKVGC